MTGKKWWVRQQLSLQGPSTFYSGKTNSLSPQNEHILSENMKSVAYNERNYSHKCESLRARMFFSFLSSLISTKLFILTWKFRNEYTHQVFFPNKFFPFLHLLWPPLFVDICLYIYIPFALLQSDGNASKISFACLTNCLHWGRRAKVWTFIVFYFCFHQTTVSHKDAFLSATPLPFYVWDIFIVSFSLSAPKKKPPLKYTPGEEICWKEIGCLLIK